MRGLTRHVVNECRILTKGKPTVDRQRRIVNLTATAAYEEAKHEAKKKRQSRQHPRSRRLWMTALGRVANRKEGVTAQIAISKFADQQPNIFQQAVSKRREPTGEPSRKRLGLISSFLHVKFYRPISARLRQCQIVPTGDPRPRISPLSLVLVLETLRKYTTVVHV